MSSENVAHWFYVELTLLKLDDSTTTTINLTNRHEIANFTSTYGPALIKDINGLGARMGDVMPQTVTGAVIIDNSPGSFGWERRFSDLLERYTLADQQIRVYYAATTLDDYDLTDSWTKIFQGKIKDVTIDPVNETISVNYRSGSVSNHVITRIIDPATFASAPTESLGVHLPFCIGEDVEVKAYPVSAKGATSPQYAYATSMLNVGDNQGVQSFYCKNASNAYGQVQSASNVSTAVWTGPSGAETTILFVEDERKEIAFWTRHSTSSNNYIITQIDVRADGLSDGALTIEGQMTVRIYDGAGDSTKKPERVIAQGTVDLNDYQSTFRSASDGWITVPLEAAFVASNSDGYWISIDCVVTDLSGAHTGVNFIIADGMSGNHMRWTIRNDAAYPTSLYTPPDTNCWRFQMYGVKFSEIDSTYDPDTALSWDGIEATQKTAISSYVNPDISRLDLVFKVDGTDYLGNNSVSIKPQEIARTLSLEWYGALWQGGGFQPDPDLTATYAWADSTTSSVYRKIGGATSGRQTAAGALQEMCQNIGARIANRNSEVETCYWTLYTYGTTLQTSAVISDQDAQIMNIELKGTEAVINTINVFYARSFIKDASVILADSKVTGYAGALSYSQSTTAETATLSTRSQANFGRKLSKTSLLNWVNDATSAAFFARMQLAQFAKPHWWVELLVPFQKYYTLDVLDVVEITHPDLPAYFGTSSDARLPYYDGMNVDINEGNYYTRTQRYRAQIEGRQLEYNQGETPMLRLTTRILNNYPADPT